MPSGYQNVSAQPRPPPRPAPAGAPAVNRPPPQLVTALRRTARPWHGSFARSPSRPRATISAREAVAEADRERAEEEADAAEQQAPTHPEDTEEGAREEEHRRKPEERDAEHATLRFEVRDTGSGMTTEQMRLAFQAFAQVGSAGQPREEGSGLGLVISRHLCRAMGGDIELRSVAGEGTTASFMLPELDA